MGNSYTSYTLRGPSQEAAAAALAGRVTIVTPSQHGCIVVFDEQSESQDLDVLRGLGSRLSGALSCPVLAVINHDDDVFWYQLFSDGRLADEYDSSPGYFDGTAESVKPENGDAQKLCAAFGASDVAAVERILRKGTSEDDGYTFAVQLHGDLIQALGLATYAFASGYRYISKGQFPDGLRKDDLKFTH